MAIEGAYAAWPRNQKLPGRGRIRVLDGQPILPEELKGREERELVDEIERRVRQCQAEIRQRMALESGADGTGKV